MKQKQWSIIKKWRWLLLPLGWMAVIFALSAQSILPGPQVFLGDFIFKKGAHMFVFGMLYIWWRIFLEHYEKEGGKKIRLKWLWALVFTVIYAGMDEYHQSMVPGRTATLRDVGFDTLGAVTAMLWSYRVL